MHFRPSNDPREAYSAMRELSTHGEELSGVRDVHNRLRISR